MAIHYRLLTLANASGRVLIPQKMTTGSLLPKFERNRYVYYYQRHPAVQQSSPQYRGMLDIPVEMIHLISDHMDNQDLRAFALTSRFLCDLLLPMYLHRRGLKLKSTRTRWNRVEVHKLEGFTSLGLWSTVPIFHPPEEMFCAFPTGVPEAKSALRSLSRFLQDPSNTTNLEEFHFQLGVFDSRPLMLEAIEMYKSLSGLPLIRLWISGYGLDCLPRSFALRSKLSRGFPTLTSLTISSDHVFAPGLVGITMGMLNQSPIESLTIWMVSLSPCQWSALLGELNMTSLEDIELEGDIPQSALIRFFRKHSGLKTIRVGGNMPLGRIQPSRQRSQSFLPHLHTLHAPLALSYDIIRQASDVSILRELNVEVSRIQPDDPLFCRLVENLQHFQNLYLVGLQLVPCSPPAVPEANPSNCNSDGHPARDLRQVRILSFFQSGGQLSTEDIVSPPPSLLVFFGLIIAGCNVCLHPRVSDARNSLCNGEGGCTKIGTP